MQDLAHENVMSGRLVSPHSAAILPPSTINPAGPPRGRTWPMISFQGGGSKWPCPITWLRSRDQGVSFSSAKRAASEKVVLKAEGQFGPAGGNMVIVYFQTFHN